MAALASSCLVGSTTSVLSATCAAERVTHARSQLRPQLGGSRLGKGRSTWPAFHASQRCSRVVAVAAPMSPGKSSGNDKAVSTPVVRDAMCRDPIVVTENTPVREALKMLVENNFTGMPVVNAAGECIGVVSDFDLIALDSISGEWTEATSMFPPVTSTWTEFKDLRKVLDKTKGKTVYDVMTKDPVCVRETTNLEVAAKMLLNMKMRRLPVVDGQNKVVGILTRKNVIKEALKQIDLAEK